MTAIERQQHAARMSALRTARAEVDAEQCIRIKIPVLCERELRGHRFIPRTLLT